MDVVPYVVEVITELSSLNANASIYNRTALGHYPVRGAARNAASGKMNTTTGEIIKLKGFNLNVNDTASDNYEEVTKEVTPDMTSGEFVPSVNGIPAINNINNNNAKGGYTRNIDDDTGKGASYESEYETLVKWAYNRLPNNENNNLLNDDIYFDVWDINDRAAVPINGTMEGVRMQIAPAGKNNGMIQYASTFGNLYFGMADGSNSSISNKNTRSYLSNKDAFIPISNGFHIDANGNTWSTGICGEEIDIYSIMGSLFGNAQIGMEKYEQNGYRLKTRFQSTSMASTTGTNLTNLYIAYYDALNDQIRFRAGAINSKTVNTFNQLYNRYTDDDTSPKDKDNKDVANGGADYASDMEYVQLLAGHNGALGSGSVISKTIGEGDNAVTVVHNAGRYVSIAVIPSGTNVNGTATSTDTVCAVWYDATSLNRMLYSYIENPLGQEANTAATGWSPAEVIFEGGGEYCQVAVDAKGGIHMAAYANGNLEYAYKSSYSADTTSKCTVDALDDTGTNISLDVALNADGTQGIPYIGYYNGQKPKYAYLVSSTVAAEGVVSDTELYTQNWEITVVPTVSSLRIAEYERINTGVWKDKSGKVTYSTKDGEEWNKRTDNDSNIGQSTWSQTVNSTASASTYGNGTKNGVVAYVVENKSAGSITCLETAQKRD